MTGPTRPAAPPAPHAAPPSRQPWRTTDRLLLAVLVALVLLIATVGTVGTGLYLNTVPVPAPTAPTRHVTIRVQSYEGYGTVQLTDPTGTTAVAISPDDGFLQWQRDIGFGQTVEVSLQVAHFNEIDATIRQITCEIKDDQMKVRATSQVNVAGQVSSCRWANDGT